MSYQNKLLCQNYELQNSKGDIIKKTHEELVGSNGQIIRLPNDTFNHVEKILVGSKKLVLFNQFNCINNYLISLFLKKIHTGYPGKIVRILETNNKAGDSQLLEEKSLIDINVQNMYNIDYGNIGNQALNKSIPGYLEGKQLTENDLLKWLTEVLYKNKKTKKCIIKNGLLLREINLTHN